jgi:hypothetical protein
MLNFKMYLKSLTTHTIVKCSHSHNYTEIHNYNYKYNTMKLTLIGSVGPFRTNKESCERLTEKNIWSYTRNPWIATYLITLEKHSTINSFQKLILQHNYSSLQERILHHKNSFLLRPMRSYLYIKSMEEWMKPNPQAKKTIFTILG